MKTLSYGWRIFKLWTKMAKMSHERERGLKNKLISKEVANIVKWFPRKCPSSTLTLLLKWPKVTNLMKNTIEFNRRVYSSQVPDSLGIGREALAQDWSNKRSYTFRLFVLIPNVLKKAQTSLNCKIQDGLTKLGTRILSTC